MKDTQDVQNATGQRSQFSSRLGYMLAVAGSAVGLGNIWRFPYLAAKYGGGIFLLVYVVLMLTFGFVFVVSETAMGRLTRKSPIGAFLQFGSGKGLRFGGWINAIVPMIIIPYYCVIGGWVAKYLFTYITGAATAAAQGGYFESFLASSGSTMIWFALFAAATVVVVVIGVEKGVERASKILMPLLLLFAVIVACYSVTRPGAIEGLKYLFIPDYTKFSVMTVVAAMGQMFYSLSIAMGVLYTYGSYMDRSVDIEKTTKQIEIMDFAVAILAGIMIIPAVFSFSGGDPDTLNAGPSLMFITLPKVFDSMAGGSVVGAVFFLLVLFAALTSSISLMESGVSTFQDQLGWRRGKSCAGMSVIIVVFGFLCCMGYGAWSALAPLGMSVLDFMDFLSNSVMMPIAALCTCVLIIKVVGIDKLSAEVKLSSKFKRERMYSVCIKYLAPAFLIILLISMLLTTFGIISS